MDQDNKRNSLISVDKDGDISVKDVEKQIKKRQKKGNAFYRAIAAFVRWVMGALWPTKIYFKDNFLKNSKAIIICNHYSALDPCVIISRLMNKDGKTVMKQEVAQNKFIAKVADELGCIPIKRGEADVFAVKKILASLNRNQQVLIFPEGTRNRGDFKEMLPFKTGVSTFAIKTRAPIIPLMYYKKTGPFKRNRLFVGAPIWLDEFYDRKANSVKEEATEYLYAKMCELREDVDVLVENCKGNKKKYLKFKRNQGKELLGNVGNGSKE